MRSRPTKLQYEDRGQGEAIAGGLLAWFALHQRDLPWRRSRDPYRIWVSEVMLQQTRVEAVIPYYERWFAQFPTLEALAAAPQDQVLKAWEGLGYYSRARNLHKGAQLVMEHYGGQVPADEAAVRELPGVGPYTAGAILSIAFNLPVPAVDGNVMRVLSRLFRIGDDIMKPRTREGMEGLLRGMIPLGQANPFNQALMELGALICTPTSPKCGSCPVAAYCQARQDGLQTEYPVKSKAKPPRSVDLVALVIESRGRFLIERRPTEGLLGGLWAFPMVELHRGEGHLPALHRGALEQYDLAVLIDAHLADVRHVFTHLIWHLKAYLVSPAPSGELLHEAGSTYTIDHETDPPSIGGSSTHQERRWVTLAELAQFAFPVAHQQVITALQTHLGG